MATPSKQKMSKEDFGKKMHDIVKYSYIGPCIGIGCQLGLFDKMAEFTEACTAQEIADALNYKER
jgi:hypothetical protein